MNDAGRSSEPETYELGLALAGAISAGAYTAGVLDFLFQALNEYEASRKPDDHRLILKVMAGASAGAIAGALSVVALGRGLKPTKLDDAERAALFGAAATGPELRCVLPRLYRTWVELPRMVATSPGDCDLLSVEDVAGGPITSVLNATLLDELKRDALAWKGDPLLAKPFPFIASELHVYLTVSNLRGIPFQIDFGTGKYGMQTHGDRFHYRITGLGSYQLANVPWLEHDKPMPDLPIASLPLTAETPPAWNDYGEAALASAAFPVGLAPRTLFAPITQYYDRSYPFPQGDTSIEPAFPPPLHNRGSTEPFTFLNLDGGMINNNPFEFAQYALMRNPAAPLQNEDDVCKTVIMVAPFPEPPAFLRDGEPTREFGAVLKRLLPTFINQARFKPAEIIPALHATDHTRWLISPQRSDSEQKVGRYPIASGLLGGFGGFLDEAFRQHDFQLGRCNCQRFLERHFKRGDKYLLPLRGTAGERIPLPTWPRMRQAAFDTLVLRIGGRAKAILGPLLGSQTTSLWLKLIGWVGLPVARQRLLAFLGNTIMADLVRRDQIVGWELPDGGIFGDAGQQADVRLILAELIGPAFDLHTARGIAKATNLELAYVTSVLHALEEQPRDRPYAIARQGEDGNDVFYVLRSRARSLPVRLWRGVVSPPTDDRPGP